MKKKNNIMFITATLQHISNNVDKNSASNTLNGLYCI